MSIEKARAWLAQFGADQRILELDASSATVPLAAQALHCAPARIAKTLSFKSEKGCILIVCAGNVRINNKKFKECFHIKAKMLTPEEVYEYTGHHIGGVCPFGISNNDVKIYTDISLKAYSTTFPACGSSNSAIELSCEDLYKYSSSMGWVDVCS